MVSPVSLGAPQMRERGAAQKRINELQGTLEGMEIGNNTAKVLEALELGDAFRLNALVGITG